MRRALRVLLLLAFVLLLPGCGYGPPTTSTTEELVQASPDPTHYGRIQIERVREYRKPTGWRRFPDGGTPVEAAMYLRVLQEDHGRLREFDRIDLSPIRPGRFGTWGGVEIEWTGPDRFTYRLIYGFTGDDRRMMTGIVQVPALSQP